jgi:NarL family two-component system response regulator LiaR
MRQRVRGLAADAKNGAIIVFSFSDDAALAGTFLRAGAQGFISKGLPAEQIVNGIRAAAHGERVMLVQASTRAAMSAELQWPGRDTRLTERAGPPQRPLSLTPRSSSPVRSVTRSSTGRHRR